MIMPAEFGRRALGSRRQHGTGLQPTAPENRKTREIVPMSSVQIRDVRKSFGNFEVLHGVSIPIEDGEFVVLVGPSGCGKSTLLRMLAGLENISSGTISIGDRVVNNVQPKERDIAMVFQNYALYPHMPVADNMGFSLKLRGASTEEIGKGVKRAAEILALTPLLDRDFVRA